VRRLFDPGGGHLTPEGERRRVVAVPQQTGMTIVSVTASFAPLRRTSRVTVSSPGELASGV